MIEQCEVRRIGGPGDDGASEGLALDDSGGGVVTGFFSETVELGGGATRSAGGTDVFVTRFGPSDEALWTRALGGSSDDRGLSVALDTQGNVYATGVVAGTVDFGTGPAGASGEEPSCFVAKLAAADGHTEWAVRFPGSGPQYCREVTLDREGTLWVVGAFSQRMQLGGFPLESAGSNDLFVARLEPANGQVKHAWRIGGRGNDLGRALAIDPRGRVLVAGQFSGELPPEEGGADFGGGVRKSAGDADAFLALYEQDGTHVWSTSFGGPGFDLVKSATVSPEGVIWAVGPVQWRTGFGGQTPLAAAGFDAFLSRRTGDGTLLWERRLTRSDVQAHSISLDAWGRAWVSGHFKESLTVGETVLRAQGKSDVWFGAFSSDGQLLVARSFGGPGSEYGYAIAVSPRGEVVLSGQFNEQLRVCGRTLTSAGSSDAFRVRMTLPVAGQH